MAQSQPREITIERGPEEHIKQAFLDQWEKDGADTGIYNLMTLSRVYGMASTSIVCNEVPPNEPIDYKKLPKLDIAFNQLDPINTAGSLVLNQNPNALDFQKQKPNGISVNGVHYHRSRTITIINEMPIYLAYNPAGFGFTGRSAYQRGLYPLKSFIQTMITDDLVAVKAGTVVAKLKGAVSIVDQAMQIMTGIKRNLIKIARSGNVISIGHEEDIAAIDLTNVNTAMETSRNNIIKNIATGADMPAKLLLEETLAEGFGEGVEDAKHIARWVDRIRKTMGPAYRFYDQVVMYRAWTPEFYKTIVDTYPEEYGNVSYNDAFYRWKNSFKATWPNLLTEPDSEKIEADKVKMETIIGVFEVLGPLLDPENKATAVQWMADNLNNNKFIFTSPLVLDMDALEKYTPPEQQIATEPKPGKPLASADAIQDMIESTVAKRIEKVLEDRQGRLRLASR